MADNSTRTPGTGETIATDDIAGVKYPRAKLVIGADGTAVDIEPPDADAKAASKVLPAGMVYVHSDGTWYRARGAGAGDALTAAQVGLATQALFNEATIDRARGNTEGTLLASAARTATTSSANQTNYNARGAIFFLRITSAGTGNLGVTVDAIDPTSSVAYQIIAYPTVTTGNRGFIFYPGAGSNASGTEFTSMAQIALPRTWRATVVKSDGSSWTYSLGHALVL